jgi:hypothetical protein
MVDEQLVLRIIRTRSRQTFFIGAICKLKILLFL